MEHKIWSHVPGINISAILKPIPDKFSFNPESKATEERVLPYGMTLYCHRHFKKKYYLAPLVCSLGFHGSV